MSTRNIKINSAYFDYMSGSIDFTVRPKGDRYHLSFGGNGPGGLTLRIWDGTTFKTGKIVGESDVIDILDEDRWNWDTFVGVWQGWVSGFRSGQCFDSAYREEVNFE